MAFDPNISLGSIITIVSTAASILIHYVKTRDKVEFLEERMNERFEATDKLITALQTSIGKLQDSDRDQAVLTQRVLALETEAKVSSLAALVQRLNFLEKEVNRMQELESFKRQNESTGARR